jgi:proteic killer suppression protein
LLLLLQNLNYIYPKYQDNGAYTLEGDLTEFWAEKITPNFRIIFRFENGDIYDVENTDYH